MREVTRWCVLSVIGLLGVCSCTPQLPSGRFACHRDSDCPEGWSCKDSLCYAEGTYVSPSTNGDAGVMPRVDAGDASESDATIDASDAWTPMDEASADAGDDAATARGDSGPHSTGPVEPVGPAPCEGMMPGDTDGIFVSPAGTDAPNCGSRAKPCSTIQRGMQRALGADHRSKVYIDSGRYAESLVLSPGLELIGGWDNFDDVWTRKCLTNRNQAVVIASPTEIGVRAEYAGDVVLDTLTIETSAAEAGKSVYGVFARGASTKLTLRDVRVVAANGGAGAAGLPGETPAAATGTCPAGDGAVGSPAGTPGVNGTLGSFTADGYSAAAGGPGGAGSRGHDSAIIDNPCIKDCLTACDTSTCSGTAAPQSCGAGAAAGCGGFGAAGGGGGAGGGASIAVYAWGAHVLVEGGALTAGDGGAGGPGGEPGQGGAGSRGTNGADGPSCAVCRRGLIVKEIPPRIPQQLPKALPMQNGLPAFERAAAADGFAGADIDTGSFNPGLLLQCYATAASGAGDEGGLGGSGSAGGPGGVGLGGPSYGAFVGGGGAVALSEKTRVTLGQPGPGGGPSEALKIKQQ
jgi:hypothetical protein